MKFPTRTFNKKLNIILMLGIYCHQHFGKYNVDQAHKGRKESDCMEASVYNRHRTVLLQNTM